MNALKHSKKLIRDLMVGDSVTIGSKQYRVEGIVGGGMGIVLFLELQLDANPAVFSLHGSRVAVKSVRPELVDERHRKLFLRELTVWAGFRHPNVVAVNEILDAGHDGWVAVMPRCEGSLRDALRLCSKISVAQATMILCDIVQGLSHAYDQAGVLHLDIKPENVLYGHDLNRVLRYSQGDVRQYRFMVSDWGIASIKQRELFALTSSAISAEARARTFNNFGTILYMAPERFIEGYRSSIASDMFSLGMMYLEMLTGMLPFHPDEDPVTVLVSHEYFKRAVDLLVKSDITESNDTEAKMMRLLPLGLLSPEPSKRPNSYEDLLELVWSSYRLATDTFTPEPEMGDPFDPQPVAGSAEEEFEKATESPSFRRTYVRHVLKEAVEKQAANLRIVGRKREAEDLAENYLNSLYQEWQNESDNPHHIIAIANAAITLGSLERGRALVEYAIARVQSEMIPLDLTHFYFHLGRIHHFLRHETNDELWCYEMAIQSTTPEGCRYPATLLHKTRAHFFALSEASVMGRRKHEAWHKKRAHELDPTVDWENPDDVVRFLAEVRDAETNEEAMS